MSSNISTYRCRIIHVTAERFDGIHPITGVTPSPVFEPTPNNPTGVYGQIKQGNSWQTCIVGDYIIRTDSGKFFVCSKELFQYLFKRL